MGLVKTVNFKNSTYVGDPINTVKLFNDKEADELIFLDILATPSGGSPPFKLIKEIASECFMPLCYGGGIRSIHDIKTILNLGVEKVAINTMAISNPQLIQEASSVFGAQSIVCAIDVKKNFLGKYEVYINSGKTNTHLDPVAVATQMQTLGSGEIMINSIDRDGTMKGYDIEIIKRISSSVDIPVIACGGAGKLNDFAAAVKEGGVSAVAAGSLFVFNGRHRAVLISFPKPEELEGILNYK